MSKLVDEIRESLKPHPVEGFCAMCYPMPTHQQMEQLMKEVERLTAEVSTMNEIHRRDLADQLELYALRRAVYRIGKRLEDEEIDEEGVVQIGSELVAESGLCRSCDGDGQDGDPDGGVYGCDFCGGTGKAQHHAPSKALDEGPSVQCPSY